MKLLLLLAVVGLALWWLKGRSAPPKPPAAPRGPREDGAAQPMLACAHCGLHLPVAEALVDAEGRAYCGEAHRLAGPR